MKLISKEELKELTQINQSQCISIYIPTHRAGKEVNNGQDPIVFKNQVQKVKARLKEKGISEPQAKEILKPAYGLLEDTGFWHEQNQGLAVFMAGDFFRYYRLPVRFQEFCMLSHSFHLKPMLPLLNGNGLYYILSLNLNQVRFFQADRNNIEEIQLNENTPKSLEESMKYTETEKSLQHHGGAGTDSGSSGAMFHGQAKGINRDDRKIFVEEFLRKIDNDINKLVQDEQVPLILAGVEYLHPIYKETSKYLNITDKGLEGSPDEMSSKDLHSKTWPLIEPYFSKTMQNYIERYGELAGTGKTSYDLKNIVPAAVNGRVEAIFVTPGAFQWGVYKQEGENLVVDLHQEYQENDDCLISMSAVETVLHGGRAYVVDKEEMPEKNVAADIVAVFRY